MKLSVAHLLTQANGSKEEYNLDTDKMIFPEEAEIENNLSLKLILYKIDEGISADLKNIKSTVHLICDKCLKKYSKEMNIPETERIFYLTPPTVVEDCADLYLIDKNDLTIELTECLRQEILLHFPSQKVCSKSCKGLCQICGKNQNKGICKDHNNTQERANSYFHSLKKLLSD